MANFFGVNIESPQERQARLVQESQRGMANMQNSQQQFGFALAQALSASFGGGKKRREAAEKRDDVLEGSVHKANLQMVDAEMDEQRRENASNIAQIMELQGATPEQIEEAVGASNEALSQQRKQFVGQATEAAAAQEVQRLVGRGEMTQEDAIYETRRQSAMALIGLGGKDNVQLAQDLLKVNSLEAKQREVDELQIRGLRADVTKKERDARANLSGSGSALSKAQADRDTAYADILSARDQGIAEDDPQMKRLKQRHAETVQKVSKESGMAPTAEVSKQYGEYRKTASQYKKSVELYENVLTDENGVVDPTKVNAAGKVMQGLSEQMLTLEALADGLDIPALSKAMGDFRNGFINDLMDQAGISREAAVRMWQDTQDAVIAKARSFGGPITESDLQGAMSSLGVSSGRIDLMLERRGKELDDRLTGIQAQAELESGGYRGTALGDTIHNSRTNLTGYRDRAGNMVFVDSSPAPLVSEPKSSPVISVDENGNLL